MRKSILPALSAFLIFMGTANATILVSGSSVPSFAVNGSSKSTFAGLLDTASGGNVTFTADMSNAVQVASADALYVTTRNTSDTLSAAEIANVSAFIATGKRVYLGGENGGWSIWNTSILSLVGGTQTSPLFEAGPSSTVVSHALTAGVSSVNLVSGSMASGGLSLFDDAFANLWGTAQNVLTFQDSNWNQNTHLALSDNQQFAENLAAWLAEDTSIQIPAPGIVAIFGLGIIGLWAVRKYPGAAKN